MIVWFGKDTRCGWIVWVVSESLGRLEVENELEEPSGQWQRCDLDN